MGINNLTEKLVVGNHYEWRTIVDSIHKEEF